MRLLYLAGPFRAPTPWAVECNVRKAEAVALDLWKLGAAVLCPHANTRFFDGEIPDDNVWLNGARVMLRRCDGAVFVPGWKDSSGSRAEFDLARALRIPTFEWPNEEEELTLWLQRPVIVSCMTCRADLTGRRAPGCPN